MKHPCLTEFIRYVTFSVLGMLGLSCYILADTFFVSKGLGIQGLAALNLAIPVYSLIHGCGLMLGTGGAVHHTLSQSRGDGTKGNCIFTLTLAMGLLIAVICIISGLCFSGEIAVLLGADDAVFADARTYLRMLLLCSPAFLLNDILICFVRSDGSPQLAMSGMLTGSLSNILLDWIFIFPCKLGIFGAVLATCMAPVISMAVMSLFFIRKQHHFHITKPGVRPELCGSVLITGAPSLAAELSSGVVIIAFNQLMLQFAGNTGVAAYGIVANLSLVVIAVFTGIGQGMQPILSLYHGKDAADKVSVILRYGVITVLAVSGILYAGIFLGAEPIAFVFNSEGNPALQKIAVDGLRLYFTGAGFAGLNIVVSVYFTATERPAPGNVLSLLRGFILILPMAFLLPILWNLTGLWMAFPAAELLTCAAAFCCYIRKKRKNPADPCSKNAS